MDEQHFLPDMTGWELDQSSSAEDIRIELAAMVELPVDFALFGDDDAGSWSLELRGRLQAPDEASAGEPGEEGIYLQVQASRDCCLRFTSPALSRGRCGPGYVEAQFRGCRLEISRVSLSAVEETR